MKVPADQGGYYHCISRVVDRRFIFQEIEKEHFVSLLRECEAFCEVEVLTYCVMSNHFHVLVSVPAPGQKRWPNAEEVLAKLRRLSGHQDVEGVQQRLEQYRVSGETAAEAAYLATFHARMRDLSRFMQLLKQRFTQWYNGRNRRRGTLWEERFRSVVVEGGGEALRATAAYIDLNPVRAGLVQDPSAYRWSGYGEAMGGGAKAREGLRQVVGTQSIGRALEIYRQQLYRQGSPEGQPVELDGRPARGSLLRQTVLEVLQARGRLPLGAYLQCRVRYFCDGLVLGSREFVEAMFHQYRDWFGPKRQHGARPLRGLASPHLFTLRDLRTNLFG